MAQEKENLLRDFNSAFLMSHLLRVLPWCKKTKKIKNKIKLRKAIKVEKMFECRLKGEK